MDLDFLILYQMKNGDKQAVERFVRKYYPDILRYCYLHISDRDYAEDITQETFEHFFSTLNRYQYRGKTKNYLYTIAANLCRDYYRKCRDIPMSEMPEQFVEPITLAEEKLDVGTALNRLPIELREVTILYYYRDRTQKDIAEILGISQTVVQRRLERAKKQLRIFLGKGDEL